MSFNIRDFKSNINDFGYVKSNKFEVLFQAPNFLSNSRIRTNNRTVSVNQLSTDILRFRIDQVDAPGVSLMSIDTNRYGIGPTQKMPFNAQFFDVSITVLLDRRTELWDFWYNWTNGIFRFNGQEPNGNNVFTGGRIPSYLTEYKDEYSTTMMIIIYNDTKEIVKKINLYEAFPTSIAKVPLAWNDSDLIRLGVGITFSNYSIEGSNIENNADQPSSSSNLTRSTPTLITA